MDSPKLDYQMQKIKVMISKSKLGNSPDPQFMRERVAVVLLVGFSTSKATGVIIDYHITMFLSRQRASPLSVHKIGNQYYKKLGTHET